MSWWRLVFALATAAVVAMLPAVLGGFGATAAQREDTEDVGR